jgi:hypothetical protein
LTWRTQNLAKWLGAKPARNLLLEVLEEHRQKGARVAGASAGGGRGSSLSLAAIEFRAEVLQTSLEAGSPILKLDVWRPLLEKYSHLTLTSASHLPELIPPLHKLEEMLFREWAGVDNLAVIFDGTTRDG